MKLTENKEFLSELEALIEKYSKTEELKSISEEQKPFDNVEPKFKVGDWINYNGRILHVSKVRKKLYDFDNEIGITSISASTINSDAHLWNIQDAKEGDVLINMCKNYDIPQIFILKKFEKVWFGLPKASDYSSHCYLAMSNEQIFKVGRYHNFMDNICPATQEQRDLLFAKMKEAGYEWDADKKELKKIVTRWRDDKNASMMGFQLCTDGKLYYTEEICFNDKYAFNTKAQAKSALAMARISQIMANDERFGGVVTDAEWKNCDIKKYAIERVESDIEIDSFVSIYHFLAFHSAEQRDLFLKENLDLVEDYLMIPKTGK